MRGRGVWNLACHVARMLAEQLCGVKTGSDLLIRRGDSILWILRAGDDIVYVLGPTLTTRRK
jgi:hypothetical protein